MFSAASNALVKMEFSTCGEIRTAFELGKRYFTFNCMFCGEQFEDLNFFSQHLDEQHLEQFAADGYDYGDSYEQPQDCYEQMPMDAMFNAEISIKEEPLDTKQHFSQKRSYSHDLHDKRQALLQPTAKKSYGKTHHTAITQYKQELEQNYMLQQCSSSAGNNPKDSLSSSLSALARRAPKFAKRNKYPPEIRNQIHEAAAKGENWVKLAAYLGVAYKTAWHWINSERTGTVAKTAKPKKISHDVIEMIISWLEANSNITLQEICQRLETQYGIAMSRSCVGNYLNGLLYTHKPIQTQPELVNTKDNKFKRAEFVTEMQTQMSLGKKVLWLDEITFNLYSRYNRQRNSTADAADACNSQAAIRGCKLHVLAAIHAHGTIAMSWLREFDSEGYSEFIRSLLNRWLELGNKFQNLIVICDKTFSYTAVEAIVAKYSNNRARVMRLEAYSPMLNPMDTIWSKLKNYAKSNLNLHTQQEANEERLQLLQTFINEAWDGISAADCEHAIQYSSSFYADALAMRDMSVVKL